MELIAIAIAKSDAHCVCNDHLFYSPLSDGAYFFREQISHDQKQITVKSGSGPKHPAPEDPKISKLKDPDSEQCPFAIFYTAMLINGTCSQLGMWY